MSRCRKRCHKTKAKANKHLKYMSGKRHHRGEVKAYLCPHPEHEGRWHLTKHRKTDYEKRQEQINETLAPGTV